MRDNMDIWSFVIDYMKFRLTTNNIMTHTKLYLQTTFGCSVMHLLQNLSQALNKDIDGLRMQPVSDT